jgi:uncharacterized protein YndB with AHSA1/START domain
MKIAVEVLVDAPVSKVWSAYVTPEDIVQWNAASDDWHTTKSTVDLRPGGDFSSRMRPKTEALVLILQAHTRTSSKTN